MTNDLVMTGGTVVDGLDAQLAEMADLVEQALEAGALGYSMSRSLFHRVPDGRNVPGTWSDPTEFAAVA